jgi:hypothetical protein
VNIAHAERTNLGYPDNWASQQQGIVPHFGWHIDPDPFYRRLIGRVRGHLEGQPMKDSSLS